MRFGRFLRRLVELERAGSSERPWITLDPVMVLERWTARVPPSHIHVVTVPPRGSSLRLLLERFCQLLRSQSSPAILILEEFRPWCESVSERMIDALGRSGYHIVGSLEDLRCSPESFSAQDEEPTEQEFTSAAVVAHGEMLARRGAAESRRQRRGVCRLAEVRALRERVPDRAKDWWRRTARRAGGR
jgi:hypothetical protein